MSPWPAEHWRLGLAPDHGEWLRYRAGPFGGAVRPAKAFDSGVFPWGGAPAREFTSTVSSTAPSFVSPSEAPAPSPAAPPDAALKRSPAALPPESPTPSRHQPPLAPPLDALGAFLDQLPAGRAGVRVVLSNHWLRYAVLPWQDQLLRRDELATAARHRLAQIHGDAVARWEVRLAQAGWRQNGLVAGVDRALLDRLEQALDRRGRRLLAVEPLLVSLYNGLRRRLPREGGLAVVEPGRFVLAVFAGGQWRHVAARRYRAETLAARLREEIAVSPSPLPPGSVWVITVGETPAFADDFPELAAIEPATPTGAGFPWALAGAR